MFKYATLKSILIKKNITVEDLLLKIKLKSANFYKKIKTNTLYLRNVQDIAKALNLTDDEIKEIFFSD